MIPIAHVVLLSGILFSIGLAGLLIRRNVLFILLSIEIMLNAVNLNFVAGSALHGELDGQAAAIFVMVVAAAEVAIGLAVTLLLFRKLGSVDTNEIRAMKG